MTRLKQPVFSEDEADAVLIVLKAVRDRRILKDAPADDDKVKAAIEAMEHAPTIEDGQIVSDPTAKAMLKFAKDSTTSRAAALEVYPRAGSQRMRVLNALLAQPQTREGLEKATGLGPNSVRPRVKELIDGGWVRVAVDSGGNVLTRKTAAGNKSEVLEVTAKAVSRTRSQEPKPRKRRTVSA